MIINIKSYNDDGESIITLSSENLDSYEHIDICTGDMDFTVLIEDIYFASKAFYERRNSRLQTDALRS